MDTRRTSSGRPRVRSGLEPLVRQLAELPDDERRDVVAAAQESAAARKPTLAWSSWEAARGVVRLGGNAVEDCDRLYDGS